MTNNMITTTIIIISSWSLLVIPLLLLLIVSHSWIIYSLWYDQMYKIKYECSKSQCTGDKCLLFFTQNYSGLLDRLNMSVIYHLWNYVWRDSESGMCISDTWEKESEGDLLLGPSLNPSEPCFLRRSHTSVYWNRRS